MSNSTSSSSDFEKLLVKEYLRFGSINRVFQKHHYNLPISFAGYDRLLSKYGIIKSAGPNSQFSESLYIMSLLANYKIPLERIYHQHAPHSLQVSTNTLHRILHYTRLGLTRRQGAILIITPENDPQKVLLGNDDSLNKKSIFGKRGDLTLPMGHTKIGEPIRNSIMRILQNEAFSFSVIQQKFPDYLIPDHILPFTNINLADIHISVYHLILPVKHPAFSSFKLKNLHLSPIADIDYSQTRPGIKDVLYAYQNQEINNESSKVPTIISELNSQILNLAEEPTE